ncbi:MAG: polysaccharide pyruvyl transferase family protein [Tildeniella torsiva UHER 1998/13D]|jgi:polysaccharide pyruvyl transferase WcaK-like protein|nr:polysaccharide pyruvyl transferase family protein [Tildeniella torsiva UHER 1998/13D]
MIRNSEQTYQIERLSKKAFHIAYKQLIGDRRCQFYDLSKIQPSQRESKSPIIQFYSSIDNIGNFLPVLGIQSMLGTVPDTWCVQDKSIDFDFINKNYKFVIIGGAGLLVRGNGSFERFWTQFSEKCKLPTVIWGVGTDGVKDISPPYRRIVSEVAKRCDLINVRDELTAETFNLIDPDISACPTVAYLQAVKKVKKLSNKPLDQATLIHYQPQIHVDSYIKEINELMKKSFTKYRRTTNYQYSFLGLDDAIYKFYLESGLVVTAMLHGAITAYGLGIPYVAISKSDKMNAFINKFGNGFQVSSAKELRDLFDSNEASKKQLKPVALDSVLDFGDKVKNWAEEL